MTVIWNGSRTHRGGAYLCVEEVERVMGTLPDTPAYKHVRVSGSRTPRMLNPNEQKQLMRDCLSDMGRKEVALKWGMSQNTLGTFLFKAKQKGLIHVRQVSLFD